VAPDFPVAAAAMLHTDCARLAAERSDAATFDRRIGEGAAFAQVLRSRPEGTAFARRWYLAVGYDLMGVSAAVRARRFFEEGLRGFPDDRDLRLAVGSVAEMEGSQGALATAEGEYRRVLEADPEAGEAHLRRGRVLGELGRSDEALHELEWVRQRSGDPRLQHLALLFRGRIEERAGHLAAAAASYRSALAHDPAGQTAHLALAHALDGLGDGPGAAGAVEGAAPQSSRRHDDGWWLYRFGQSHRVGAMLDELRREATR
jgi:tetratricopeptide (TPR) repeat protein